MAKQYSGELVKMVVDVKRGIMAAGGELHSDEEAILLESGSQQKDLWGINFYPHESPDEWIQFNSMINVRPSQGNRSRSVESSELQDRIRDIVSKLIVR